ncbi:hypothetical protein FOQG_18773 [Fusarium oxysporum f. sp. raphani 54005]|uniref:Uncharacterized protein n=1 Tax=Fusarium oxysporum f. sp. raphani 54005 TaxID=1089458 RepID=X0BCE0_FUSOX|nr:hypothetical protein FOQG_18773 [Fusarium oxysporum f. sp. raphani 54005]
MAVTRSSRTSSSTSYSKNVNPCDVHNQPPANLFKSISTEQGSRRYPFRHLERRRPGQDSTVARPTPASKKLLAIPTNSAVGVSQARSHRHSNSDLSEHYKRSFKPIYNHRAKRRMGNLKRFNMACIRSANETVKIWEGWVATNRKSPYEMKRNAALATTAIQTFHYYTKNFEDVAGDNKPKLYKHKTIQRLNDSVRRMLPGLPIV